MILKILKFVVNSTAAMRIKIIFFDDIRNCRFAVSSSSENDQFTLTLNDVDSLVIIFDFIM